MVDAKYDFKKALELEPNDANAREKLLNNKWP
jgi:hypothetical protein